MSPEVATTMSTSTRLSDIISAVPALTEDGSNWSIFKMRFRLALIPHGLYHFYVPDKENPKPVDPISRILADPKSAQLTEVEIKLRDKYNEEMVKWKRSEDIARYILSRVIPDSLLRKIYDDDRPVHVMWKMLTQDFEQKNALVQATLRMKFNTYRCPDKGDIRQHLSKLRQMHQDLQGVGVNISDRDYVAIIMQSLPLSYGDFVAHLAASAQMANMEVSLEKLQNQLEQEYDRRKSTRGQGENYHRRENREGGKDMALNAETADQKKNGRKP
jgi:gag-polypeptide of LTR copia-type